LHSNMLHISGIAYLKKSRPIPCISLAVAIIWLSRFCFGPTSARWAQNANVEMIWS